MVRRLKLGLDGIDFPRVYQPCSIFRKSNQMLLRQVSVDYRCTKKLVAMTVAMAVAT